MVLPPNGVKKKRILNQSQTKNHEKIYDYFQRVTK